MISKMNLLRVRFLAVALLISCENQDVKENIIEDKNVLPGIDVLMRDQLQLIEGKRIGLITNPTGVTKNRKSTIDTLYQHPDINLVALYGPEHGVRGDVPAGEYVPSYKDEKTNLPVYSLYGKTRRPTEEMLEKIDVLLFDIQDIGSRAYTYLYTMAFAMKAAAECGKQFIVLDRPNPLGGTLVEGPVLQKEFSSFIGMYPIPYVYGMTIGELAQFFNTEYHIHCDLTIVPLQNWQRDMRFAETGLTWIPTSPHVPYDFTPFYVASVGCIGELGTLNEGVGYTMPFQLIGTAWMDGSLLADSLNAKQLPGVFFRPIHYRPFYTDQKDKRLQGVQLHIIDYQTYRPMLTQISILCTISSLYPNEEIFASDRIAMFDRAMGTDVVRKKIQNGACACSIAKSGIQPFMQKRQHYLLY